MPSIQDIADQLNAKLDQINQNTASEVTVSTAIKNEIAVTNTHLANIEGILGVDLANISQGIFVLEEIGMIELTYLDYMRRQNDTMICLLQNSNEMLCGITRKFTKLLDLTTQELQLMRKMEGIEERVHSPEAADYDRLQALQAEMEECCPPDEPPIEPCPPPCERPSFRQPAPLNTDWRPLPTPTGKGTGGGRPG